MQKNIETYYIYVLKNFLVIGDTWDTAFIHIDISTISQINELNTYTLIGSDAKNTSYTSSMLIADMTRTFKNTKDNLSIDFNEIKNLQTFYNSLTLSNFKRYKNFGKQTIDFHFPFNSFNSDKSSQIKVCIRDLFPSTDVTKSRFYLRINDLDFPDAKYNFRIQTINYSGRQEEREFEFGNLHLLDLFNTDTLLISFDNPSTFVNDRLSFEIASEENNKLLASSISFLPNMPATTSYYLIICYCIFTFCISLILILPNIYVFMLIRKKKITSASIFNIPALLLPAFLGLLIMTIPFVFYGSNFFDCTFGILVALLLFSLPSFFKSLINEPTDPNKRFYLFSTFVKN